MAEHAPFPDSDYDKAERLADLGVSTVSDAHYHLPEVLASSEVTEASVTHDQTVADDVLTSKATIPEREEDMAAFRLWVIENTNADELQLAELDALLEEVPHSGQKLAKLAGILATKRALAKAVGQATPAELRARAERAKRGYSKLYPRG